jgi:Protein of unknown function (DUF1549)/Protein of unknown function (DUF1553)
MAVNKQIILLCALLAVSLINIATPPYSDCRVPADHPKISHSMGSESRVEELDDFTSQISQTLPSSSPIPVVEKNFIDQYIFRKIHQDGVPRAQVCSDIEFLRRLSLDLTGRLPEPEQVREFAKNTDPLKRDKLVDAMMTVSMKGVTKKPSTAFLDRWAYFFSDFFRVNLLMGPGRTLFYRHIYNFLSINQPYDEFVRGLLTATTASNFNSAAANFLIRFYVDQPDQSTVNHEDTYDELAIRTTRMFLGINLECISCHDGIKHLEKINLWLTSHKRADLWRQAAFFGKVRMYRPYGDLVDEFVLSNDGKGYDLASQSVIRLPRYQAEISPTFLLTGERPRPDEDPREAYARMITGHIQFARATVNIIWAELFGAGVVDPPLDFDLARYGPDVKPSGTWAPQDLHAELLDALAKDFQAHGFDLRYLIRLMVTSSAYQLSHRVDRAWKPEYSGYFARRFVRRLPAEQVWDAICQATGVFTEMTSGDFGAKVKYAMQTVSPDDLNPKVREVLASFGIDDRTLGVRSLGSSIVQASILMNNTLVKEKIRIQEKGRLYNLLNADPAKSNAEVVEELFLATLARFATKAESDFGARMLAENHARGAEDLLWVLLNKPEFVLNY